MKIKEKYDLVILGGGPAGLAAAIAILKEVDVSVLVAEANVEGRERVGESCPPETLLLLKQLGLSKAFEESGHNRCPGYASVWGRAEVGYNDFIVNPFGSSWCLNRKKFDHILLAEAESKGAQVEWSMRFTNSKKTPECRGEYTLSLVHALNKSTHTVQARFVIDATGSTARFAKAIGIQQEIEDQLFALVRFATITAGKISKQVQLEATQNGWWYNAMLPEQRLVSMMVTEKETLTQLKKNGQDGFESALQSTLFIGDKIKALSLTDRQYYVWPIHSRLLPTMDGEDWMAIGDAASSYDPIAAQGIHKALTDGILSANKVKAFFENDRKYKDSFPDQVKKRYKVYTKNREYIYSLEQRWPTASFWLNRHKVGVRV